MSSLGYPLLLLLTLLTPFVMVAGVEHGLPILWPISIRVVNVGFLGTFLCYGTSAHAVGGAWRRRLARYPFFLAMCIGMSVHNARAAVEGLLGKRSAFERTPKYRSNSHGVIRGGGRYRSRASWSMLFEWVLFGWSTMTFWLALSLHQYGALPFLLLFVSGYGSVAVYSLSHLHLAALDVRTVDEAVGDVVPAASAASAA